MFDALNEEEQAVYEPEEMPDILAQKIQQALKDSLKKEKNSEKFRDLQRRINLTRKRELFPTWPNPLRKTTIPEIDDDIFASSNEWDMQTEQAEEDEEPITTNRPFMDMLSKVSKQKFADLGLLPRKFFPEFEQFDTVSFQTKVKMEGDNRFYSLKYAPQPIAFNPNGGYKENLRMAFDPITSAFVTSEGFGEYVPSVTTLLKHTLPKGPAFEEWLKAVGEEESDRVRKAASSNGKQLHDICYKWLSGADEIFTGYKINENPEIEPPPIWVENFMKMKPVLEKINGIYFLENVLASQRLRIAGTVDCIAYYDTTLSVIDFKTSDKLKDRSYIDSYIFQGALYALMFFEMTGLRPKQIVVPILVRSEQQVQTFIEPLTFDLIEEAIGYVTKYWNEQTNRMEESPFEKT